MGRTARGRRTFCAQRVRSMRVQAGATTTQTRTRTRTCDWPLRRPTPTPSARRRRRLARGVGSSGHECTRAQAHTLLSTKKKSHVHGSCDDDDRHTRCCASGQRPARRERPKGVHGHAYKWRERGGGVGRRRVTKHVRFANWRRRTNTQEAGARVAMGDKKCGGRAVAQGDAVCERMCRRKAGTQT